MLTDSKSLGVSLVIVKYEIVRSEHVNLAKHDGAPLFFMHVISSRTSDGFILFLPSTIKHTLSIGYMQNKILMAYIIYYS